MFCKNCGKETSKSAKFCKHCGADVEESQKLKNESYKTTDNLERKPASSNDSLLVIGYIIPFIALIILPIVFTPIGVVLGIVNIVKGKTTHGVIQIILAVVFGIVGTSIGGAGFGIDKPSQNPSSSLPPSTNYETTTQTSYPSSVRETFTSSCIANGGNESYCQCALNEFESSYSLEEYSQLEQEYVRTGMQPAAFQEIIDICASSY